TLAFADDLALVSSSWEGMAKNLGILEAFCRFSGLQVQLRKCHGFMIKPTKDSFTINDALAWRIGETEIPKIGPLEVEKYLGLRVNPWRGLVRPNVVEQTHEWVERMEKAPLKPRQKVVVLNSFAVPRLIYMLDHRECPGTTLVALDGITRKDVKTWLYLPASIDGGMGMLKMESLIPSIQACRLHRLANSADEVTRTVVLASEAENEFHRLWAKAGGADLGRLRLTPEEGVVATPAKRVRCPVPCDWRCEEATRWGALPVQGVGSHFFWGDVVSNAWIVRSEGFRERHFTAALQLNVYPTRECLTRGIPDGPKTCRGCHLAVESFSHILGQCPAVQARIARHNKVWALLALEAEQYGWEVHKEDGRGELRKPDLVMVKGETAMVIYMTVRFEYDLDSLDRARKEKICHYSPLEVQISQLTAAKQIKFFGLVVGGKWPAFNYEILSLLGLGKTRSCKFAELVSRRAL
uniref:Reverse transcriptase domain-containing protein n=1 Tax=Lepisosteus oculatus TaxID=7918 RepID=W5LXC3_LEPOC